MLNTSENLGLSASNSATLPPYIEDFTFSYLPVIATSTISYGTLSSTTSSNPNIYPTVNPCGLEPPLINGYTYNYGESFTMTNTQSNCPVTGSNAEYDFLLSELHSVEDLTSGNDFSSHIGQEMNL